MIWLPSFLVPKILHCSDNPDSCLAIVDLSKSSVVTACVPINNISRRPDVNMKRNVIFLLIKLEIRKEQEEPKIFITVFSSDIPKLSLSQYGGAARREF